jgi:hypothetical protein
MLLSKSGPTDFCPHFCLPPGDRPDGTSCGAGSQCFKPLQVQHPQMLRPIIMTVKFAVCEVPALLHANQREVPA